MATGRNGSINISKYQLRSSGGEHSVWRLMPLLAGSIALGGECHPWWESH